MADPSGPDMLDTPARTRVRKRPPGRLVRQAMPRHAREDRDPSDQRTKTKGKPGPKLPPEPQLPEQRAPAKTPPPHEPPARRAVMPMQPAPFMAARSRRRHYVAMATFFLFVCLPAMLWTGYLYLRAADQYHSVTAFSVRSEEANLAPTGLSELLMPQSSSGASDADILYDFIRSQAMIEELGARLDLETIYNRARDDDWLFSLGQDRPVEDLIWYWNWMTDLAYDPATGIIEVSVTSFDPDDAQAIAKAVLEASTGIVNRLTLDAREDAIRYAADTLAQAERRLKARRVDLRNFRNEHRIVDPEADVTGRMGVVTALEGALAEALVARAEILEYARDGDQRLAQVDRRIRAIQSQIDSARDSLGGDDLSSEGGLSDVIGRYEELQVDLEFAQATYLLARASYDQALTEARRQSRYVAAHVQPTRADSAIYPRRALLAALGAGFLLLVWAVFVLLAYNIRDRR